MPLPIGPPAPPMEQKSLMAMPPSTSITMQTFLLCIILLLPGVDPVLSSFIHWYLRWRGGVVSINQPQPLLSSLVESVHEDQSAATAPDSQPASTLPDDSVASSTRQNTQSISTWNQTSPTTDSTYATDEAEPKPTLPNTSTAAETNIDALVYPTPPISTGSTRPPSSTSSYSSTQFAPLPRLVVTNPSAPDTDASDSGEEDDDDGLPLLRNGVDAYVVLGVLGNGASGRVVYARSRTGESVAIKIAHKAKLYRHPFGRVNIEGEKENLIRVTLCGKPFLTQLLSSWDDKDNVYFVMRMYHQNLLQKVATSPIAPCDLKLYVAELIAALNNVHASGLVHRDIKPENILVSPRGHLALADFGLSFLNETNDSNLENLILTDVVGTPGYWAPEVATSTPNTGYNCLADVWSMGMVIFEMYHKMLQPFFDAESREHMIRDMMFNDVPLDTVEDEGLRGLLERMLVRSPRHRSTAKKLKNDPYFADIDWDKLQNGEYELQYRPPFPDCYGRKKSIRFSSFHYGLNIHDGKSVHLTSEGLLVPNADVLRQLEHDQGTDTLFFRFRFPFKGVHSVLHNVPWPVEADGEDQQL